MLLELGNNLLMTLTSLGYKCQSLFIDAFKFSHKSIIIFVEEGVLGLHHIFQLIEMEARTQPLFDLIKFGGVEREACGVLLIEGYGLLYLTLEECHTDLCGILVVEAYCRAEMVKLRTDLGIGGMDLIGKGLENIFIGFGGKLTDVGKLYIGEEWVIFA